MRFLLRGIINGACESDITSLWGDNQRSLLDNCLHFCIVFIQQQEEGQEKKDNGHDTKRGENENETEKRDREISKCHERSSFFVLETNSMLTQTKSLQQIKAINKSNNTDREKKKCLPTTLSLTPRLSLLSLKLGT